MAYGDDSTDGGAGPGRRWRLPRVPLWIVGCGLLCLGIVLVAVGALAGGLNTLIWIESGALAFLGLLALTIQYLNRPRPEHERNLGRLEARFNLAAALIALVTPVASFLNSTFNQSGDSGAAGSSQGAPCQRQAEPPTEYGKPASKPASGDAAMRQPPAERHIWVLRIPASSSTSLSTRKPRRS